MLYDLQDKALRSLATSTFSLFGTLKLHAVKKLKRKVYVEIESQPTQMFQHSKQKTQIFMCGHINHSAPGDLAADYRHICKTSRSSLSTHRK